MTGDQWFALITVVISITFSGAISYFIAKQNHERLIERDKELHRRQMKKEYAGKIQSIYEEYTEIIRRAKTSYKLINKDDLIILSRALNLMQLYSTDEIIQQANTILDDAWNCLDSDDIDDATLDVHADNTVKMQKLMKEHLKKLFNAGN